MKSGFLKYSIYIGGYDIILTLSAIRPYIEADEQI